MKSLLFVPALLFAVFGCGRAAPQGTGSDLASSGAPPDVCQTQGPVKVCSANGFNGSFYVEYTGYLVATETRGACRPDFVFPTDLRVDGFVNGARIGERQLLGGCHPMIAFNGATGGFNGVYGANHLEIWVKDSQGRYDSVYGRNYHFDF